MDRLNWYWARVLDNLPWLSILAWLSVFSLVVASGYLLLLLQRPPPEAVVAAVSPEAPGQMQIQRKVAPDLQLVNAAPELAQVTHAIATLYGLAAQHKLDLQEVVYQDQQQQDEPLLRYSVDFNVTQSYPLIKAFVLDMLAAMPYLALEKIQLEREDIQSPQIEAQLTFRLFLERDNE
jgi:hypothetical protein